VPLVLYRGGDDSVVERTFSDDLSLGADLWATGGAPAGIAARHAVITRSQAQFPVLVDFAEPGRETRVNGVDTCGLRALCHGDRIRIGPAELIYWEIVLQRARREDVGRKCPFCTRPLEEGVEVVLCPRCKALQHKRCWFNLEQCCTYACQYPVQQTLRRTLSPPLRFEDVETGSTLVRDTARCPARRRRDAVPFQADDVVTRCPDCEKPYHAVCWFARSRCATAGCGYDIEALLRRAFTPGADPASVPLARPR